MSGTRLLLLRHGETRANRARRIQGRDDSPLTAEGMAATRAVAAKLQTLEPEPARLVTYCSPLPRARATLEHLRRHLALGGHIHYDDRLVEIDFGALTGRAVEDVLPLIRIHKHDTARPYPGGESGDDLKRRVLAFLDEAARRHDGHGILVMTHFGVIETALRHYFGIPVTEAIHPPHDAVHRIDLGADGTPRLTLL